jgi:hypothetical protein
MCNSSFCKYGLQGYKSYKVLRQKYVCLYDTKFKNALKVVWKCYLFINLIEHGYDVYFDNYKMLMKDIKKSV